MKKPLLWLLGLELAYWVPARLLVWLYPDDDIPRELVWTVWRLASALAVYLCLRKVIWPEGEQRHLKCDWVIIVSGLAFVAAPALTQNFQMSYPANVVYAATSLAVGLREELVYRGVLQRLLTRRWGLPAALVVSNVLFIFYHFGAIPFTGYNVFQFFAAGTILGLIYHRTNSLACVVILHAVYDGILCFTPFLHPPLSLWRGVVILLATLVFLMGAAKTSSNPVKLN
jgi:membrane protease YdiL (CAAX protease family)